jgi:hypothetical protein
LHENLDWHAGNKLKAAASRGMTYPRSVGFRGFSLMIVQNQGVVVGATAERKMRPTTGPSTSPRRASQSSFVPVIRPTVFAGEY